MDAKHRRNTDMEKHNTKKRLFRLLFMEERDGVVDAILWFKIIKFISKNFPFYLFFPCSVIYSKSINKFTPEISS
jgi:hypothetical protein